MCHIKGIQTKGIKAYLKGFTEPFFLLTPINLIGEIANPISLSFRLFGNLVGGLIIMSLVYGALSSLSLDIVWLECADITTWFSGSTPYVL